SEQALLQVLAESVVDGQRDDERCHARSHSDDGDGCDHADDSLPPLGAEIAGGDEEFKGHLSIVLVCHPDPERSRSGRIPISLKIARTANSIFLEYSNRRNSLPI